MIKALQVELMAESHHNAKELEAKLEEAELVRRRLMLMLMLF